MVIFHTRGGWLDSVWLGWWASSLTDDTLVLNQWCLKAAPSLALLATALCSSCFFFWDTVETDEVSAVFPSRNDDDVHLTSPQPTLGGRTVSGDGPSQVWLSTAGHTARFELAKLYKNWPPVCRDPGLWTILRDCCIMCCSGYLYSCHSRCKWAFSPFISLLWNYNFHLVPQTIDHCVPSQ